MDMLSTGVYDKFVCNKILSSKIFLWQINFASVGTELKESIFYSSQKPVEKSHLPWILILHSSQSHLMSVLRNGSYYKLTIKARKLTESSRRNKSYPLPIFRK